MDQDVRSVTQSVEPVAGHGVPGDDHRGVVVVDAVAHGRVHGGVVGGSGRHPHVTLLEHHPVGHVGGHCGRPPGQVCVMGEPVADVGLEHCLGGSHEPDSPDGADDGQRAGREGHRPPCGDEVVEIGDVVAVEMGEEDGAERNRAREGARRTHRDTAARVEQEVADRRSDQGGGTSPVGSRDGTPTPQDHYLHIDDSSFGRTILTESMTGTRSARPVPARGSSLP